jgi:hemoglobin-like flavoprotein
MKSWKTTLAGAIAALAAYLAKDASLSPVAHQIAEVIASLAIMAVGFFAKDDGAAPAPAAK